MGYLQLPTLSKVQKNSRPTLGDPLNFFKILVTATI